MAVRVGLTISRGNLATVQRRLDELKAQSASAKVNIGLPNGTGNYPDGTSVIMVGSVHEFGAPEKGIPERSFLRSTMSDNRDKYKNLVKNLVLDVIEGNTPIGDVPDLIGQVAEADVKQKIVDINEPPNAPQTIAAKGGKTNPLVNTGLLTQSIRYEVENA